MFTENVRFCYLDWAEARTEKYFGFARVLTGFNLKQKRIRYKIFSQHLPKLPTISINIQSFANWKCKHSDKETRTQHAVSRRTLCPWKKWAPFIQVALFGKAMHVFNLRENFMTNSPSRLWSHINENIQFVSPSSKINPLIIGNYRLTANVCQLAWGSPSVVISHRRASNVNSVG